MFRFLSYLITITVQKLDFLRHFLIPGKHCFYFRRFSLAKHQLFICLAEGSDYFKILKSWWHVAANKILVNLPLWPRGHTPLKTPNPYSTPNKHPKKTLKNLRELISTYVEHLYFYFFVFIYFSVLVSHSNKQD